jgi:hypothetical protein
MVYPQSGFGGFGGMVSGVRNLFARGTSLLERFNPDLELPWLQEQIRTHAGAVRLRHSVHTDNFTGETLEMRLAYRRGLAEPAVKAALIGKIANVASLNLNVKPAGNSDLDKEVADFIRHCLTKCSGGSYHVIWSILSGGLVDGWSLCEKKLRVEDRSRFRGKWVLERLKSKDTRQIEPEIDQYRNVTGFYSFRANAGHWFPPDRFVHFSYLSFFENPTGQSDLRAVYRSIEMIPAALKLRMLFLDKFSGPWLKGKVKDKALKRSMADMLKNARSRGYIVLDEGSDVEVVDMAVRGTDDFQKAIEDLRQDIAVGISGAFLHMLTGMNPGARGDSEVQRDTVYLFVWLLATMVATAINEQLVPQLVDWNYGMAVEYPTAHLEAVNPQDVVADLQIDKALKELGFLPNKKYILEKTGRPGYDPEDPPDEFVHPAGGKVLFPPGAFPAGGGPGAIPAVPFAEPVPTVDLPDLNIPAPTVSN